MKRILPLVAVLFASCTADPRIGPDPIDASIEDASSSSSSASSSSSSSASSSSSSASSSSGNVPGDSSGTRLKRRVYSSPDGLLVSIGYSFYDSALNINCAIGYDDNAVSRCMPLSPSLAGLWFADPMCSTPLIRAAKSTCPGPPGVAIMYAPGIPCSQAPQASHWHEFGTQTSTAYAMISGACKMLTMAEMAGYDAYSLGPEVDYSQYALLDSGVEP